MRAVILIRDAENVQEWSGLPYFICKAFIERNKCIEILQTKKHFQIIEPIFNVVISRPINLFYKIRGIKISYSFIGSWLYRLTVKLIIYKNKKKINDADYLFSIINPYGAKRWIEIPIVSISDGSLAFLVKWKYNRKLIGPEIALDRKNNENIVNIDIIICLFNEIYNELYNYGILRNRLIYFSGGINLPIVNNLTHEMILNKYEHKKLVFIGRKHYLDGALKLIEAFKLIKLTVPSIELVIIGLSQEALNIMDKIDGLEIIPFLDKSNILDLMKYTDHLKNATLFINVASIGGAYMSTIEAMAYGTPFILKSYPELYSFMQEKPESGLILEKDLDTIELSKTIISLLRDYKKWMEFSCNGINISKNMKWSNLIEIVEERIREKENIV